VRELVLLWVWTIAVALLGTLTCFTSLTGINWALWTAVAVAGLLVMQRQAGATAPHSRPALTLAVLVAGAACVTANPYSVGLIALAVAALSAFAILAIIRPPEEIGPAVLALAPYVVGRRVLGGAVSRIAEMPTVARMSGARLVMRGGVMAVALAVPLFLLLSAADPTLADWRDTAGTYVLSWDFLAHDAFFVALATCVLGAYGVAARTRRPAGRAGAVESGALARTGRSTWRVSDIERVMVFSTATALFVLFFSVELSHGLASRAAHVANGETLAEATHRGFGEMVAAAALCALVIITLDHHALRGTRERLVRILAWGVIGASLLVVASAYQRVRFYEAAYGYTEQRVYVQVCCTAVAMALLLLAYELRSAINLPRLSRHVALAAVLCVGALAYWNSVAWIVEANVDRYQHTGKLDVDYLAQLAQSSPDAVPALVTSLSRLPPGHAEKLRSALRNVSLDHDPSWYEWNLRRASAASALCTAGLFHEDPAAVACPHSGAATAVPAPVASGSPADTTHGARSDARRGSR